LASFLTAFYVFRAFSRRRERLSLQKEGLQEKLNILSDRKSQEQKNLTGLREKISRYNSLKVIIEELNQNLSLEFVADKLLDIASSLVAGSKGTCLLYLVDNQTQKLLLFKTKKEDNQLIIKAKEALNFAKTQGKNRIGVLLQKLECP
ncbi:MAG: hypothetical protein Q8N72_01480, partial [Candidatus Omnitrophota bacterium]|nr:hypothetical protein [Candidatus Omnitrophota bacterium]